jgi:thiosulfate/3-mercaptopyruvate sulfurtransferase
MRRLDAALLAAVACASPALAQQPDSGDARVRHHREYLVTTEWLGAHLRAPDIVVLQVGRSDAAYRAGHIPGALFLPLSTVATTVAGIPNEFPPAEWLAATFRDLGVGDSARIVLYGDDAGLLAARAWVALDLLGQSGRAALLDGGLSRWAAERRPIETAVPTATPRPFTARWQGSKLVTASWVRAHLGDSAVVLVDARPAEQYAGAEPPCPPDRPACGQIPPERRGHLPGASSLYWMGALASQDDPVLRPMHELHEVLWKPTGADRPAVRTLVTYCRTGMQASHAYFVARYIGYPDVRLYDGSFIEWAGLTPAADYPVEGGGH